MLEWVPTWYWIGMVLFPLGLAAADYKKSEFGFWGCFIFGLCIWFAGTLTYWGCWLVWTLSFGLFFHTPFDVPWWLWVLIFVWPTATYGPVLVVETANFIIAIFEK